MKTIELGASGIGSTNESWFRLEVDDGKPYWVHAWRDLRVSSAPDVGELRVALDAAAGRPYYQEALSVASKLVGFRSGPR